MRVYAFVEKPNGPAPDITAAELIEQMKCKSRYTFGTDNLLRSGVFRLSGWAYDLREELNLYVYKQYGTWHEAYAPNRGTLRRLTYGRIDAILETNGNV